MPEAPSQHTYEPDAAEASAVEIRQSEHAIVREHMDRIADQIEGGLSRDETLQLLQSDETKESRIIQTAVVQSALVHLRYNSPDNVDGLDGPLTREAVRNFQKDAFPAQSKEHDGICGPKTTEKLIAALADPDGFQTAKEVSENDTGSIHSGMLNVLSLDPENKTDRDQLIEDFRALSQNQRNAAQVIIGLVSEKGGDLLTSLSSNPSHIQTLKAGLLEPENADPTALHELASIAREYSSIDITDDLSDADAARFISFMHDQIDSSYEKITGLDAMINSLD